MNIGLIVLDSVRKDYWDKYAPRLKSMADIEIEQCYAASSWSAPSHASIVTGKLPSEIGIHTYQKSYSHVSESDTVFEIDSHKLGVSSNMYANTHYDFDTFFDEFYNLHSAHPNPDGIHVGRWLNKNDGGPERYLSFLKEAVSGENTLDSLKNGLHTKLNNISEDLPFPRPIDEGTRSINRKISENRSEPWFIFANYMETHTPHRDTLHYDRSIYDVDPSWSSYDFDRWEMLQRSEGGIPEEFEDDARRFRDLYASSIDYVDRELSATIEKIRDSSDEETTFILTADHGENLMEEPDEDTWGHTSSMSDGLLHVPMVIIGAPGWMKDSYDDFFSSHLDLRQLIENIVSGVEVFPTRERIPCELVGGGVDIPEWCDEWWDRSIRVVYDREDGKYEWDSLGNRNREDWDDSVYDEFSHPIDEMREHAMSKEDDAELDGEAEQRLKDLGYV